MNANNLRSKKNRNAACKATIKKLKDDELIAWIMKNDTDEPGISPVFGKQIISAKKEARRRGLRIPIFHRQAPWLS